MSSKQSQRRLRRFFSSEPISEIGQQVLLPPDETRHLKDVLRLVEKDHCLLIDDLGVVAEARIDSFVSSNQAQLSIETILPRNENESRPKLFVYVGIPQKGKMDYLIEKAQELGIDLLCPLETQRTVIRMAGSGKKRATARWEKIAKQAAKQSGNLNFVEVLPPKGFEKCLESLPQHAKMVLFHPGSEAVAFKDWIESLKGELQASPGLGLHLFIGPEGGFSDEEAQALLDRGAKQVHLGESLLKVDTAFLGVMTTLRLLFT